jgi:purine-nucleoside phosphorylase
MMIQLKQKIEETAAALKAKVATRPVAGIILGTGLGGLAKDIVLEATIPYEEIPYFPASTVESHAGKLLFGTLSGKPVVAMQGRFHFYEGYSPEQITFPVRVMGALGAGILIVSNASGGLNPLFKSGDIMAITDHINLLSQNPLVGQNDDRLGPRFPDMFECYDRELLSLAEKAALEEGITLVKGVYAAVTGPNLETAAEYRFLRIIGADAVGMSTIPEVLVARHSGLRVLGFSLITDMGLPETLKPTRIEEVLAIAAEAEPRLRRLITRIAEKIP